jgi:hypothetical protein
MTGLSLLVAPGVRLDKILTDFVTCKHLDGVILDLTISSAPFLLEIMLLGATPDNCDGGARSGIMLVMVCLVEYGCNELSF